MVLTMLPVFSVPVSADSTTTGIWVTINANQYNLADGLTPGRTSTGGPVSSYLSNDWVVWYDLSARTLTLRSYNAGPIRIENSNLVALDKILLRGMNTITAIGNGPQYGIYQDIGPGASKGILAIESSWVATDFLTINVTSNNNTAYGI